MRTHYIALLSILGVLQNEPKNKALTAHIPRAYKEWWENTLVYQIWPRGFQDSNGDGEGDLKGIINRLDYIKDLGVETICLNPIYLSPLIDSGYDVSNYTDIHPLFGDLDGFDNLVQKAHNRGLRIILDMIPNHSSDQHQWFQLSAQNIEPYTDYYIWANGSNNDSNIPPNNWVSTYSDEDGSAWTWNDQRKQWYYHKFHVSQPDLNLRNEKVIKELMDIFDFWLGRKIGGFRINAVPYFFEDEALRNEPVGEKGSYTFGLPASIALLYIFRKHIDDWVSRNNAESKLLIAESYDTSNENLMAYYGNGTHKGIAPTNFKFITHIHNSSDANYIKHTLDEWIKLLPGNTNTNWVLSNHDNSRATSRIGLNRVDGLHMLSLLLPGQAYTFYGEEIAMLDTKIFWNRTIDPMGCARGINEYEYFSRDPARTPMQWNSETSAGFSKSETTYLPVHPNYIHRNVAAQRNKKRSNLRIYKQLAILRKELVFTDGDYEFASLNNNRVLVMKRFLENYPIYITIINLYLRPEKINLTSIYPNLEDTLKIVVSSGMHDSDAIARDNFILTANAALVLKGKEGKQITEEPISSTTEENNTTNNSTKNTSTTTESLTSPGKTVTPESSTKGAEKSSTTTESTDTKSNNAALRLTPILQLVISAIIIVTAS